MSKLYGDSPSNKNRSTEISLVQVLTVFAIVLITLVIPAQLFTYNQRGNAAETAYNLSNVAERAANSSATTTTETGKVAGISTRNSIIQIPGTNSTINLNSQTGIFIIAGIILIALALILVIYLLITG